MVRSWPVPPSPCGRLRRPEMRGADQHAFGVGIGRRARGLNLVGADTYISAPAWRRRDHITSLLVAGLVWIFDFGRAHGSARVRPAVPSETEACSRRRPFLARWGVRLSSSARLALDGRSSSTGKKIRAETRSDGAYACRYDGDPRRRSCTELSSLRARGDNATAPLVVGSRRGPCATPE